MASSCEQMKTRKYNVVVMGDQYCGKTSIIERYTTGRFGPNYVCTIGAEFYRRSIEIDNKSIKLHVFDTAGQESMKTVIRSIYRRAQGILLVFDFTRQKTLDHINGWIDLIEMNCDIMPHLVLAGNKIDLPESRREVASKAAQCLADSKDMKFYEVSAKTNHNIDEAFNELARQIYKDRKRLCPQQAQDSIKLKQEPPKSECCLKK